MVLIPKNKRDKILAIAQETRLETCEEGLGGVCYRASTRLSQKLTDARIEHELVGGDWVGSLEDRFFAGGDPRFDEDEPPSHAWIRFPQYDDIILDITADQFADVPSIWFPAEKKNYDGWEVVGAYRSLRRRPFHSACQSHQFNVRVHRYRRRRRW